MTLNSLHINLTIAYFLKEAKQLLLVYIFAFAALAVLIFFGKIYYTSPTTLENIAEVKGNKNETLYAYVFFIGIATFLLFYVVYAFFFYPKKFSKDKARIKQFITCLQNGGKIIDYIIYPMDVKDETLINYFITWEYMWFELTDETFSQTGTEEYFLVPSYCKETLMQYYDRYGNDKNIEETWQELSTSKTQMN
jgi:hypothetical protein